jgi:hypothetical protein
MFTIKETIEVNAPMARVWGIFARMNDWKNWNSACENCRLESGSEIAEGVCFNFMLRPYYLPMKVTPKVIQCEPGKKVVWAGGRLGIQAEHTFYFNEENSKVTVTSVEHERRSFQRVDAYCGQIAFHSEQTASIDSKNDGRVKGTR